MGTYLDPFNVKLIIHNYFLGTQNLFTYAFVIIVAYACAKYQMSNTVFLILLTLGCLMFFTYIGESILVVILFIIGFITFKAYSKFAT